MKKSILLSILGCCAFSNFSYAQGIMNAELNVAPMAVNPAFTGGFDGTVRVSTFYNKEWADVSAPYVSYGISADLPIIIDKKGNFVAGGVQLRRAQAGDGNLANFSGLLSVAYHKIFRGGKNGHSSDLAIGVQAGYDQSSIPSENLFTYMPPSGQYHLGIGSAVNYYAFNTGISLAHSFSNKFSFIVGVAGYNLNQPKDHFERKQNGESGFDRQYVGNAGLNISVTNRFSIKPAVFYLTHSPFDEVIAGSDFGYIVSKKRHSSLFLGGWYRNVNTLTATAGAEFSRFRIGVAYDYTLPAINPSYLAGGLCLSLRYTGPGKKHKRMIQGSRS